MSRGGGIKKVSSLLEKYTGRLQAPEKTVVRGFCKAVKEILGLDIDEKWVSYTPATRTLGLRIPGTLKTEIQLKKKSLLEHMQTDVGAKNTPNDIV